VSEDCDSDAWSLVRLSERTWSPEVVRPVHIQPSTNPVVIATTAATMDHHARSSSVPVRTGRRDKSSTMQLQASANRNRMAQRTRFLSDVIFDNVCYQNVEKHVHATCCQVVEKRNIQNGTYH